MRAIRVFLSFSLAMFAAGRLPSRGQTSEVGVLLARSAVVSNSLSVALGDARGSGSLAHGFALATGAYSIAMGFGAMALHDRTFVWSDSATPPSFTTSSNQFVVHAGNGIHLLGGPVIGNGAGLTGLVGSNIVAGSIGSAQLAAAVVTRDKLAPGAVSSSAIATGVVGTGHVAAAEWNAWGDARFLNASGSETLAGSLTVSNLLTTGQMTLYSALRQSMANENMGIDHPSAIVSGQTNSVWIGYRALYGSYGGIGIMNTAVGRGALQYSMGSYNSAIGAFTMAGTSGMCNQAVGYTAGAWTIGNFNSSFGWMSSVAANGNGNSAYGHSSREGAAGNYNCMMGYAAGNRAPGDQNSIMGMFAGYAATGSHNTAMGSYAMGYSPGRINVAVGYAAGYGLTAGMFNTFVGANAGRGDLGTAAVSNSVALGAHAQVTANDTVVLGNTNHTVVIGGTSASNARFVVSPAGNLTVKGETTLLRVLPMGDLAMGSYTNAP